MKKISILVASLAFTGMFAFSSCGQKSAKNLTTSADSAAYMLGYFEGSHFQQGLRSMPGDSLDIKLLMAGIEDALMKKNTDITPEKAIEFVNTYFMDIQKKLSESNKVDGAKFLEENKSKEGVVVTSSGLQYKVIKEGEGDSPKETDKVTVHYTGKLINGKVFDSSVERGEPATFPVNQVIPGWTEGLQLMKKGAKFEFYIPSELAYGERGAGNDILPNSVLVFEVELIDIQPGDAK